MADKAKHAYGSRKNLEAAIASGAVDAYDVLFLNGDGEKPAIGWVDKNKNPIIIETTDSSALEGQVAELESELATKANAEEVNAKIDKATVDTMASAKAYTDKMVEVAVNEHMVKKFEITSVPDGTLVDYRDKEIRVMCPVDTKWVKQAVGGTGNANMYYMGFKAYAPDGAVSFKEGDRGVIIDEMFDFSGDFAGTDEYGRNFSICWLALASYDAGSDTWTYFGKNSSAEKYIGWDYVVEWYNADGVVIASDCVRINLSNENCHSSTKPYYVGGMMKDIETMVDTKIAENSAYEIVEF